MSTCTWPKSCAKCGRDIYPSTWDVPAPNKHYGRGLCSADHQAARKTGELTERQIHILDLVSQGFSLRQIAKETDSTRSAVGTCLSRAYLKLGATSGPHAVRLALEAGILPTTGTLRAELRRVYAALAAANEELAKRPAVPVAAARSHPFSDYLLGLGAVA